MKMLNMLQNLIRIIGLYLILFSDFQEMKILISFLEIDKENNKKIITKNKNLNLFNGLPSPELMISQCILRCVLFK